MDDNDLLGVTDMMHGSMINPRTLLTASTSSGVSDAHDIRARRSRTVNAWTSGVELAAATDARILRSTEAAISATLLADTISARRCLDCATVMPGVELAARTSAEKWIHPSMVEAMLGVELTPAGDAARWRARAAEMTGV